MIVSDRRRGLIHEITGKRGRHHVKGKIVDAFEGDNPGADDDDDDGITKREVKAASVTSIIIILVVGVVIGALGV